MLTFTTHINLTQRLTTGSSAKEAQLWPLLSSIFRWYFSISLCYSSSQWPLHHSSLCHTDEVELKAGKSANKAREEEGRRNPSSRVPCDIARFMDKMNNHSAFPCLRTSSDWRRDCFHENGLVKNRLDIHLSPKMGSLCGDKIMTAASSWLSKNNLNFLIK